MNIVRVPRLVKPGDLNHHGSLYAGRAAEWFVEACYLCAAQAPDLPGTMVCLAIRDLVLSKPVRGGERIQIETRPVKAVRTSLTIYGKITTRSGPARAEGFVTFVCVGKSGRPVAHRLRLDPPRDAEEKEIQRKARNF